MSYKRMMFEFVIYLHTFKFCERKMAETNINVQTFDAFYETWLIHLECFLPDLIHAIECGGRGDEHENEQHCRELIHQVSAHYGNYFKAMTKVIQENVFLVLTPTWLSSFERAYMWIGGFRPALAFRLLINTVHDLTDDQSQRIDRLNREIKEEENQVSDEFDKVLDVIVSPPIMELTRQLGRLRNGAQNSMESALDRLMLVTEGLVECAEILRKKTGVMLIEILKPSQAVKFLAAATQLQLRLRSWGMQRDNAG